MEDPDTFTNACIFDLLIRCHSLHYSFLSVLSYVAWQHISDTWNNIHLKPSETMYVDEYKLHNLGCWVEIQLTDATGLLVADFDAVYHLHTY